MKDHLAQKVHWRYVINLPGQAFPLRTPEEMVDILRVYNGTNDIEGIYTNRITKRYTEVRYLVHAVSVSSIVVVSVWAEKCSVFYALLRVL